MILNLTTEYQMSIGYQLYTVKKNEDNSVQARLNYTIFIEWIDVEP